MRNYTNSLLFESALDSISSSNPLLSNTAERLFNPVVKVVEDDCGTLLGTYIPLTTKILGNIELDSDLPIQGADITSLATSGASEVAIRTVYSCISEGGVCRACLVASRPRLSSTTAGSSVKLSPELLVSSDFVTLLSGATVATLPYDVSEYDVVYLYNDGILLSKSSYSISGTTLTLSSPVGSETTLLVKFYVASNVAYYYWLANTYSGSLLGIKSMLSLPLPVKASLLGSLVNESDIEALISDLSNSAVSGEDFLEYIPSILDPLEKAIFVVTLGAIFLNP